ncbi:E3 ubiquitin ligase BIG BROTHER-related-like isoform X2 [Coffea eugenioides]|nr:E3 ubiquitin ligase BIG BROTHER-related-like isoform X3 [Coffea arabica]XP_027161007.1 E3 ubiquitin ligase BIG BROTHER-related-like isoform X2 [Coffea eugenioides]
MMSETFVIDNNEVSVHLNDRIPAEIAENFKEFFPEDGDLSLEEVLLQQESAFQYIQANGKNKDKTSNNGQTSNRSQPIVQEGECSSGATDQLQSATDEALARALQEYFYINEPNGTVAESREPTPSETPVRVTNHSLRQDDIDPDNMTYEELQSLGEAVGHESKGLSEVLIARLPTFKYKTGLFSKKRKKECVICCSEYKSGARLTTLPCAHQYHSECITRWLKLNKNCPVCQEEVRED